MFNRYDLLTETVGFVHFSRLKLKPLVIWQQIINEILSEKKLTMKAAVYKTFFVTLFTCFLCHGVWANFQSYRVDCAVTQFAGDAQLEPEAPRHQPTPLVLYFRRIHPILIE